MYGKRILYIRPKSPIYTAEKAMRGFELFERLKMFMAKEFYIKEKESYIFGQRALCKK